MLKLLFLLLAGALTLCGCRINEQQVQTSVPFEMETFSEENFSEDKKVLPTPKSAPLTIDVLTTQEAVIQDQQNTLTIPDKWIVTPEPENASKYEPQRLPKEDPLPQVQVPIQDMNPTVNNSSNPVTYESNVMYSTDDEVATQKEETEQPDIIFEFDPPDNSDNSGSNSDDEFSLIIGGE